MFLPILLLKNKKVVSQISRGVSQTYIHISQIFRSILHSQFYISQIFRKVLNKYFCFSQISGGVSRAYFHASQIFRNVSHRYNRVSQIYCHISLSFFLVFILWICISLPQSHAQNVNPYSDDYGITGLENTKIIKNHIQTIKAIIIDINSKPIIIKKWFYNKKGNKTKQINYREDGELDSEICYSYDVNGKLTSLANIFYFSGDSMKTTSLFSYDELGFCNQQIDMSGNDSVDLISMFKYDEWGRLMESHSYGGDTSQKAMINYEYNTMGNLQKKLVYKWFEEDWVLIYTYLYFFDDRGNLIEVSMGKLGNVLWTDTFKYSSKGLLIESIEHDPSYPGKKDRYKYIYEFFK